MMLTMHAGMAEVVLVDVEAVLQASNAIGEEASHPNVCTHVCTHVSL